jgi:hypothetical protein
MSVMKYRGREGWVVALIAVLVIAVAAIAFGPQVKSAIAHLQHAGDSLGVLGMGSVGMGLMVGATRDLNGTYLFRGASFGPGKGILVPDDFPEIDKKTGAVIHPKGSQAAKNQEIRALHGSVLQYHAPVPETTADQGADGPGEPPTTVSGLSREELNNMSKQELEALAEEKGIDVPRTDGRTDLAPRTEDYQAALGASA